TTSHSSSQQSEMTTTVTKQTWLEKFAPKIFGGSKDKFAAEVITEVLKTMPEVPFTTPEQGTIAGFQPEMLLPPVSPSDKSKICLVVDLDETMIHSAFEFIPVFDFVISTNLNQWLRSDVYVTIRPGLNNFLATIKPLFE